MRREEQNIHEELGMIINHHHHHYYYYYCDFVENFSKVTDGMDLKEKNVWYMPERRHTAKHTFVINIRHLIIIIINFFMIVMI